MKITDLSKEGMLASYKNPKAKVNEWISLGSGVKEYQATLEIAGYKLENHGADGKFGKETEDATLLFQCDHGLKQDGVAGPKTLNELMYYAYANFEKEEFACKCNTFCGGFPAELEEDLLVLLQNIRNHFRKPVHITSGIRCKQHNANVGGVVGSQHLYGKAADIKVDGISPGTVYAYADKINLNGGVGRYNTFTHVDVREDHKRFDYRK